VDSDFSRGVLERVRQRRARPASLRRAVDIMPFLQDCGPGTRPCTAPEPDAACTSQTPRPCTAPQASGGFEGVRSKYLLTALVHQHGVRGTSSSSAARPSRLSPLRPRTAPEAQPAAAEAAPGPEVHIVEAPTTLVVNTANGPTRVPPHHWLVLEGPGPSAEGEAGEAERRLLDSAGGGLISKGTALLRRVSEERLHAVAAEANFQRASRGTSTLALRHAAHALELLAQRDRDAPGLPGPPLSARESVQQRVRSTSKGPSVPSSCTTVTDEVFARLQRMESIVALQAAAAEQRAAHAAALSKEKVQPEMPVPSSGPLRLKKSMLLKGWQARVEFLEFAQRRYGNIIRTWFLLDREENMKLGEKHFVRRVLDMGFSGNVPALWRYMDSDRSGSITILELDAHVAVALAGFKSLLQTNFDDSSKQAWQTMDKNRSGHVHKAEFVEAFQGLGYEGSLPRLFDLLDRGGLGYVVEADLAYLDRWQPRPYLFSKPDFEGLADLKEALLELYWPSFKAWRKILDRDGTMRVNWEEFCEACRKLALRQAGGRPRAGFLAAERMAGVWRALDADCSGWISLREFDTPSHKAVAGFKRWADRTHGSAVNAFHAIDGNSNGKLHQWELQRTTRGDDGYEGDVELLFESLDVNSAGWLTEGEFKFLDSWDLDWEEWEAKHRR